MALSLSLDYALQIVTEPGYYKTYSSADWQASLNPSGTNSSRAFWTDQATRTLMLMPLQLQPGWLNTSAQTDSIVGLVDRGQGKLHVNPANLTSFGIYEANIKQNVDNPWVHFQPIPGTTISLAELLNQLAIIALDAASGWPIRPSDSRVIAYTEEKLKGNQALYLRWFVPDSQAGAATVMGFTIGQFVLVFSGDHLQILEDISPAKDRTAFRHLMYAPLFAWGATGNVTNGAPSNRQTVQEAGPGERAILWLPFRKNLIYIEATGGQWAIIDARTTPRLNNKSGNNLDWDIVDDRELLVWGVSPSVGRFQVQKVKWWETAAVARIPTFTIDYSPGSALTAANLVDDADTYRGTSISHGTPSTPPGYDNFVNTLDTCPAVTTDGSAQTRQYGVSYTFNASADKRFTPFLYGVDVRVPRAVGTWAKSAIVVGDDHTVTARIRDAEINASLKAGDTNLAIGLLDAPPLTLAAAGMYYRSDYPLALFDTAGPTTQFVGIAETTEVEPLKQALTIHRDLRISATSLWKWLSDTPLRDQRDWTNVGHITAVDFIAGQAGIDTSGADYPSPLADWNTPLGGVDVQVPQTGALKPHWKPSHTDTAASFITRIAEQFSGYKVGFYPDGRFYYLPSDPVWYYTASEVTFKRSRPGAVGPVYEDPVQFESVEPEANVVQVIAKAQTGGTLRSALMVDWASIKNPLAPNFIGRWRLEIFPVDGVLTCREINRFARVIWNQTRRRHLMVKFKADYYPALKPGRVFTLDGEAGTWRLMSYTAQYIKQGYKQAEYEAELVEQGYL